MSIETSSMAAEANGPGPPQTPVPSSASTVAVDAGGRPPTQRTVNRKSLSFPEKHGAWLLSLGAAAAWVLAVAETTDAVSTVFAVAGFLLLAAAAFYSRVVRVSREGVDLADIVDVIEGVAIEEGDTPADAKARAIEEVQRLALPAAGESTPTSFATRPSVRRALMERDRVETNLRSYFAAWLQRQNYAIKETYVDRDGVRTDIVAERPKPDGTVDRLFVEVRSAVAVLRASDAAAILARKPRGSAPDARRALVLRDDAIVMPDAEQRLIEGGTSLFTVNVDAGIVHEQTPPQPW